ncbi:MAG: fibronectin type III domain-containing protein [Methanomassiliicoccus sp.]|nr:fibronectin type III domain-containing protein [Methanomassiliicoccus sp.]
MRSSTNHKAPAVVVLFLAVVIAITAFIPMAATAAVPDAPTGLTATPENAQVQLSWTAPTGNVTGYKIYRSAGSGETILASIGNSTTTYTDGSVSSGITYTYTVSAVNEDGEGAHSNSDEAAISASAPSAPQSLRATIGDAQVTLTWSAPTSDGGASINHYIVYQDGVDVSHPTTTSAIITGLTNGQAYSFAVAANNSVGDSDRSSSVSATPNSTTAVPGAPTGLSATPGDAQVALSWTAPTTAGGAAIDYYIVYQDGVDVAHPTTTSATITGLTNGQAYSFSVAAHNSAGAGSPTASVSVTPSSTAIAPNAPTALSATPGSGEVYLSWLAPVNNGGAAIDYYIVYRDGVDIAHPALVYTTISGLQNDRAYIFTVAAHNSAGTSGQSSSVVVTPSSSISAPSAPTNLEINAGDGKVTLSWNAPTNAGSAAIDYYIVYQDDVDVAHTSSTSIVIDGLTNGQSYKFEVAAHNSVGIGARTTELAATPAVSNDNLILLVILVVVGIAGLFLVTRMQKRRNISDSDEDEDAEQFDQPLAPAAPVAQVPQTTTTRPIESQIGVGDASDESVVLCPRCGRPNSGRTNCVFCGKKLK